MLAHVLTLAIILLTLSLSSAQADPAPAAFLPFVASPPTPGPPGCNTCAENTYNCDDFPNREAAQSCFDYCYNLVGYDVHDLDRDHDMLACEWLPESQPILE
jgi:hypothetical protein